MNSGSSNGGFTIPLLPLKMVKNDNRYGIRIITSPITRSILTRKITISVEGI